MPDRHNRQRPQSSPRRADWQYRHDRHRAAHRWSYIPDPVLDRHLDGGLQLGILIEDNAQRKLEFGEDNRTHWRDIRPPMEIDIVIYPATGVIELMAPGGAKLSVQHVRSPLIRKAKY